MLSWEYPPHIVGGMGKHVADLIPALQKLDIEVHLITPSLRDGPTEEQIGPKATVYRVPCPDPSRDGKNLVTFVEIANRALADKGKALARRLNGFDLIHAHDWLTAYSAVALKATLQLPLVATIHATERGRGQGYLIDEQAATINGTEWWLTYESWHIITVSHFMAQQLHSYFSVPSDKLSVVYNGINVPSRQQLPDAERRAFRRRFADDDQPLVFNIGRMVYEKGVQILIAAAPRILATFPTARFVVAGTGAFLQQLQSDAAAIGVERAFTFTGFISDEDRDRLFEVADVAVFPSLYEPFGIVALEAMAHRCPVVASSTGGLQEVVRPHENGLIGEPGNPESLAWAIIHTLQRPDWARQRAEQAYQEVVTEYNWEGIAAKTAQVYRQVHSAQLQVS